MASAGKILIIPRGNWVSGNEYKKLDMVYFNGSSYIAKNDILSSTITPDIDTDNWQLMAGGFDNENIITKDMEISQEDIEPIEGEFPVLSKGDTVKTVFSKIKKFFEDFKSFKDGIITLGELRNNGTTTETGKYALDAAYGKTLSDLINQLSDFQNLSLKNKELTLQQINADTKNFYIGQITQATAIAIGITDAVCPYMIAHLPFGTYYPSQILLSTSEEKRMFYRMCNNGIWESPKELITTGKLINNGLTTEVGKYPLDAAFGKILSDQITQLNSKIIYKILWTGKSNTSGDLVNVKDYLFACIAINDSNNSSSSRALVLIPLLNNGVPYFYPAYFAGEWRRIRFAVSDQGILKLIDNIDMYITAIYGCIKV